MQTLKLADHLFEKTKSGGKSGTIRWGRRDIALGPLLLTPVDGTCEPVAVEVERVTYTAYGALTEEDKALNGHTDIRPFYPALQDADTVTIVQYRLG